MAPDGNESLAPWKPECGPPVTQLRVPWQGQFGAHAIVGRAIAVGSPVAATDDEVQMAQANAIKICRIRESPSKRTVPVGPSAFDRVRASMLGSEQLFGTNSSSDDRNACSSFPFPD